MIPRRILTMNDMEFMISVSLVRVSTAMKSTLKAIRNIINNNIGALQLEAVRRQLP